jgi:hypothetical protein
MGWETFGLDWAAIVLVLYRYYTTTQFMVALILTCVFAHCSFCACAPSFYVRHPRMGTIILLTNAPEF